MATLREYFQKDAKTLTLHKDLLSCDAQTNEVLVTITGRLHYDFEGGALYVSFYIPKTEKLDCPARLALSYLNEILKLKDGTHVQSTLPGDEPTDSNELVFTGRIFIYDENDVSDENKDYIYSQAKQNNHTVKFRGLHYSEERSKLEKPLAFISHDTTDKELIAKPLALELQKMMCPVWYDEFSLKVGDSLREGIEGGLTECRKCILVLTKHFLSNNGWGKREYDSIFTRELIERQNVILPVWCDVTPNDIFQYSPMLADRVGLNWNLGVEEVAKKLYQAINA